MGYISISHELNVQVNLLTPAPYGCRRARSGDVLSTASSELLNRLFFHQTALAKYHMISLASV